MNTTTPFTSEELNALLARRDKELATCKYWRLSAEELACAKLSGVTLPLVGGYQMHHESGNDCHHLYLGGRLTDNRYRGQRCIAVRRADGKCIRGKNGNMLVEFEDGEQVVLLGRLLRKLSDF